jgi:hypothetical protein
LDGRGLREERSELIIRNFVTKAVKGGIGQLGHEWISSAISRLTSRPHRIWTMPVP